MQRQPGSCCVAGTANASDTAPTLTSAALIDGTLQPWGSAETKNDTYFYIVRPQVLPQLVSVMLFSPDGRAHLRDVSVVAGWQSDGVAGSWTIVPARMGLNAPFEERLTIPPYPDQTIVDLELAPGVLTSGRFNAVGLACLSTSRGDRRNWLSEGDGVYVRQLILDRTDTLAARLGVHRHDLWRRLDIPDSDREAMAQAGVLDSHGLVDLYAATAEAGEPVSHVLQRIAHRLYVFGEPDLAATYYRRALALTPRRDWHSNLLQAIYASPATDNAAMLAACAQYSRQHFAGHETLPGPFPNQPDPERRLRIGFLGYYFQYPIARTHLLRLMAALDRSKCEVLVYDDGGGAGALAEARCADAVRDTRSLDDRALAERLRADVVDVAIDLIGHLPNNRFGALAFRPAPLQATYYNWQATTGLPFIDHVFADHDVVPVREETRYSETVLRPRRYIGGYTLPEAAPPVAPPPLLRNGFLTVGSFGSGHKLNASVLHTWATLLSRNPSWRFYLKNGILDDPAFRERIVSWFERAGVGRERLMLRGQSSFLAMLDEYREVDLALGPWPFIGGSTIVWALGQGVPVAVLQGDRHITRAGAAILRRAGLHELVADAPGDYIRRVEGFTADPERLCALRASLRDTFFRAFADMATLAADWEEAVRGAWRRWCDAGARVDRPLLE